MVFVKGSIKTKEAARKGGKTGTKYLAGLPKAKLKKLTSKAGKQSGKVRRAKKLAKEQEAMSKRADRYADKIMHSYLI